MDKLVKPGACPECNDGYGPTGMVHVMGGTFTCPMCKGAKKISSARALEMMQKRVKSLTANPF